MKTVKQHECKEDYAANGDSLILLCFLITKILLFLSFD